MKIKTTPPLPLLLLFLRVFVLSRSFPHASSSGATSPPPASPCAGSGEPPVVLAEALGFCGYSGVSCCDAVDDAALRASFEAMNVSEPESAVLKDNLCSRCRPPRLAVNGEVLGTPSGSAAQHEGSICLERIAAGSYLTMTAYPPEDGSSDSSRVFLLSTQDGKIWLASVDPKRGSLRVGTHPFLNLADLVHHDAARGLGIMGVAFHPRFPTNGRFFVSYACNNTSSPAAGSCSATTGAGNGSVPCPNLHLVVAEFSANGGGTNYSKAVSADPSQVRRVFTMVLPEQTANESYNDQRGGQILFPPAGGDGYLYLIAGRHGRDEDSKDDERSTGNIIRLDVDRSTQAVVQPEITLAAGMLKNPRGCNFDSENPDDLYCASVDQVYLINDKTRNYSDSSATAIAVVLSHGRPPAGKAPSIIGGLVYRGSADPWLKGRYIYMYGFAAWATDAMTESSTGLYTASRRMPNIRCSGSSSVPCPGGSVLSFGEDNRKDAYFLTTDGLYRLAEPSLCSAAPSPPKTPPGLAWLLSFGASALAIASYMIYMKMFGGGGQSAPNCSGWFSCCATIMCCNNTTVTNNFVPTPHPV